MKSASLWQLATATLIALATPAMAHAPILACYDEGDNTVLCEAGYSDGAPSTGQSIRILSGDQRLILETVVGEEGTVTFDRPEGDFYVEFIGDSSHVATVESYDILQ